MCDKSISTGEQKRLGLVVRNSGFVSVLVLGVVTESWGEDPQLGIYWDVLPVLVGDQDIIDQDMRTSGYQETRISRYQDIRT